ncbi:esterase-like activity of phytase family protein [Streptomyces sp. NPDC050636]|uniref:esterase-like activity of phytase family protein n=1 Tax=Streptomyces sp. NPDC050636 TaxID=3154510 RepID=UPI003421CDEF
MSVRQLRRPLALALPVAVLAAVLVVGETKAQAGPPPGAVTGSAQLPAIPLGEFSNAMLPGSVGNDRGVKLGGIGSDIFPAGRPGEFWTVTDRGPNGRITVDGTKRRTFPVPGFDPAIVKIRVAGDHITVLDSLPITTRSGKPVTGLPNQPGRDEAPYTYDAGRPLSYDPDGLDTEGIVRATDGSFWLADEYGPSLVHVSASGRVLARYVPKGLRLTGTGYPVVESLPGLLLQRKTNRGFEGLALLPDGDLVAAVQSPLSNPDTAAGEASRNARLLRFSPAKGAATAEYAYRFDPVGEVDPGEDDTSELKISSVVAVGRDRLLVEERTDKAARLLVEERTDKAARLQLVELAGRSDILGSRWDDPATSPSLEQSGGRAPVLPKRLAVDLNEIKGIPEKIEGIAVSGPRTRTPALTLINDNDFGMTDGPDAFDDQGRLVDSGVPTTVTTVRLRKAAW